MATLDISEYSLSCDFFFFFFVALEELTLARKTLYHMSHSFNCFCCYFGSKVSFFFFQADLDCDPPGLGFLWFLG
jgi:hypothetical protein